MEESPKEQCPICHQLSFSLDGWQLANAGKSDENVVIRKARCTKCDYILNREEYFNDAFIF